MDEGEIQKKVANRKKNLIDWLRNPENFILSAVIIFAFVLRLYYFFITKNQALWWDEACYTSLAKNLILHIWDGTPEIIGESMIRPVLFPFILSILARIGFTEIGIRFLFVLISTASVIFLYYAVRELYDKKIALVSAAIYSILWIQIFYTNRILVHILAQALLFPSIYFFIKSMKGENFHFGNFGISMFLLSITTLIRYTKGIIFFAYAIIFLIFIVNQRFKILIKSKFWISAILGFSPLLIFFVINFINTGNIFPALLGGSYLKPLEVGGAPAPYFWHFLNYIPMYLGFEGADFFLFYPLLVFFIIGLGKVIFDLIIGYDALTKDKKLHNHLFLILILVLTLAFFIFYLKGGEDRYLFPASISIVAFPAIGIILFYDIIKKYNKIIALAFVFIVLAFGAYQELKIADELIKSREESYMQQKQGFEWIKGNTPENSTLLGSGIYPYAMYYAERSYIETPNNLTDFLKIEKNADYLLIHGFTPTPDYLNLYLQNQTEWEVKNVFFIDNQNKQPIFIIYSRKT
jgi:4-amino-4-deoxy-L-arabinose transferase-like glycosyltransferase